MEDDIQRKVELSDLYKYIIGFVQKDYPDIEVRKISFDVKTEIWTVKGTELFSQVELQFYNKKLNDWLQKGSK